MKNFAQRQMASSMEWTQSRELRSIMLMLKILGISIDMIAKQTRETHVKQEGITLVLQKVEGMEKMLVEEQEKRRRISSAVKSIYSDVKTLCSHFSLDTSRQKTQEQEGLERRSSLLPQEDELVKHFGRVFEHFEEVQENLKSISSRVEALRTLEQRVAQLEKLASPSSPYSRGTSSNWGGPEARPSPPASGVDLNLRGGGGGGGGVGGAAAGAGSEGGGRGGAGGRGRQQRSVSLRVASLDRGHGSLLSLGERSDTVMVKREFVSQHLVPASLTKKQLQELQVSFAPSRQVS
eukprot:768748-Hanusia_phi.AAC.2